MRKNYFLSILMLALLMSFNAESQILTFEFSGLVGNEATANSNSNDSNIGSSTISRGAGLTPSSNGNRFNAISWATTSIANAVSGNDYMEFTITPNSGFEFSITSIQVNIQRSGTGPSEVELRSSLDGYTNALDATKSITDNTSAQSFTFTFSQTSSAAVTYRFYMWAESTSGSGGFEGTGNDIVVNGSTAAASQSVGFDSATSSQTETNATFNVNIPVTLSNYGGSQVDLSVTVDTGAGTAESGDYTLNTASLSFTSSTTMNISLDINDDADTDNETVVINIAETTATGITISISQHTVTITDDETPDIVISEIMYNTPSTDDEWVEIYNAGGSSQDISGWTIVSTSASFTFTFPGSTTIASGEYITIAVGSNGDETYNNDNPFTPDYNNLSVDNSAVAGTSNSNQLGNATSTLTLNNGGSTIDTVTYDDGDITATDGSGPSYEIIDPAMDNSLTSANWRASNANGGSPGSSAVTTWTGTTSNDWTVAGNWDNGVPSSSMAATIPSGVTNYPTATAAVTINFATIASGASLIAQSTFAGNITYNRSLGTTNWYLVGSPVGGETIEDLITNNDFDTGTGSNIGLAPYLNDGTAWSFQTTASTGALTSGGGYSVKLSAAGNISFSGTMPVADVGVSITSNTNAFNLAGNPYPSFIAANTNADATNNLLTVNTSSLTENTIWLWDQATSSYDATNQASAAFHVAPGQGFFVSSTGANTFNFTEAMQSHQSTDSFQRTSSTRPEILLTLTDGSLTRNVDIFYIDGTTTGWDNGYDSTIFAGVANEFAIYTHLVSGSTGQNLGIQSLPDTGLETMVIPVGINTTSGTDITISAAAVNLPSGFNVYLEDKEDDSFTLLNDTSEFSTTLTSDLNGIGRFYIHTTSSALSTDEINLDHLSVYTSDNNNLRIVGIQNGRAKVNMYDILGKQVLATSFQGNGLNNVSLPNLRAGIYIVQLETENGKLNTKLIIE